MECPRDVYLNIPSDSIHYKLSLDELDVALLPMSWLMDKCEAENTRGACASFVEFELSAVRDEQGSTDNKNAAEDEKPMFCHICNIAVPKKFSKEHDRSRLHETLLQLANEAVGRLNRHNEQQLNKPEGTYYCAPCNKEIHSIEDHEKEPKHQALKRREDLLATLLEIYTDEHEAYTDRTETFIHNGESQIESNAGGNDILSIGNNMPERGGINSDSCIHKTTEDTEVFQQKLDLPDVTNTHKDKNEVQTCREDTKPDIIQVRTKNGDLLAIPKYHFHGIQVSSFLMNNSVKTSSDMRCMLCNERGMKESEIQEHMNSSKHRDYVKKLALDKYGIRKVTNLVFSGQTLGHCVICNFIVCDASLHIASPEHQKRQQLAMKNSLVRQNAVDDNTTTIEIPKAREDLGKSLQGTIRLQSPTDSIANSDRPGMSQQGASKLQTPTEDTLGSHKHHMSLQSSLQSPTRSIDATNRPEMSLQGAAIDQSPRDAIFTPLIQGKGASSQSSTDSTHEIDPTVSANNIQKTPDENLEGLHTAEDIVEVQTENGELLLIPQYNFHGIRTTSNLINNSENQDPKMRCMLCKQRGIAEAEIKKHLKSSMHTRFTQKLVMDNHGIRNIESCFGPSLGHCVVCNFMISDAELHIASPEHQTLKQNMTKKSHADVKNCAVDENSNTTEKSTSTLKPEEQDMSQQGASNRQFPEVLNLTAPSQNLINNCAIEDNNWCTIENEILDTPLNGSPVQWPSEKESIFVSKTILENISADDKSAIENETNIVDSEDYNTSLQDAFMRQAATEEYLISQNIPHNCAAENANLTVGKECDTTLHAATKHLSPKKSDSMLASQKCDVENNNYIATSANNTLIVKTEERYTSLQAAASQLLPISPRQSELPEIVNKTNKTPDKPLVNTRSEGRMPVLEVVEVSTENGDLLVVPKNHFHSIRNSSKKLKEQKQLIESNAESTENTNVMRCMLCQKRGMKEAELQKHVMSSTHMECIQKLTMDKDGIRQNTNLIVAGQSIGHCVICNVLVQDPALHISSAEHKKRQHTMNRSLENVRKNCDIKANPDKHDTSQQVIHQSPAKSKQSAISHQLPTESSLASNRHATSLQGATYQEPLTESLLGATSHHSPTESKLLTNGLATSLQGATYQEPIRMSLQGATNQDTLTESSLASNRNATSQQGATSHPSPTEIKLSSIEVATSLQGATCHQSRTESKPNFEKPKPPSRATGSNRRWVTRSSLYSRIHYPIPEAAAHQSLETNVSDLPIQSCKGNEYYCTFCAKLVPYHEKNVSEHNNGAVHRRNVELLAIDKGHKNAENVTPGKDNYCIVCRKKTGGVEMFDQHLCSRAHKQQVQIKKNITDETVGRNFCQLCNVEMANSLRILNEHYNGKRHVSNFKMYLKNNMIDDISGNEVRCILCLDTMHIGSVWGHVKSLEHVENLERYCKELEPEITFPKYFCRICKVQVPQDKIISHLAEFKISHAISNSMAVLLEYLQTH